MSIDVREATVSYLHDALRAGKTSCRGVVEAYLARIERFNPSINAIISLNEDVLRDADTLDAKLVSGHRVEGLFGIPVLLKDNFDAQGMPTTAGSVALKDNWPQKDAVVVKALRDAGAIILGKTNLHEFALEGLTVSSLGGQTISPFDPTRTAGGSSGGSGAAVAASFAVMATGTDTVNSLRNPASANSLYSFRPTPGLISREGVIPVSSSQDAIGMICGSLKDAAIAFTVMSAPEHSVAKDTSSMALLRDINRSMTSFLAATRPVTLSQIRIGILPNYIDTTGSSEATSVAQAMLRLQDVITTMGTTVIDIDDPAIFDAPTILEHLDVQVFEVRTEVDRYLSSHRRTTDPVTFADVFRPSKESEYLVIPAQYSYIHTALASSMSTPEYAVRRRGIAELVEALHGAMKRHELDAIIYPQQRRLVVPIGEPSQSHRNGILAAVTGSPVICIPIGFGAPTKTAPIGLPIGMEILGLPHSEAKLFAIARAIDEVMGAKKAPCTIGLTDHVEVTTTYANVPRIVPAGLSNIDLIAYPPGQIE